MKSILILGNGFDIAHGLPTQYKDFLNFAERVSAIYTWKSGSTAFEYEAQKLQDWTCSKLTQSAINQFKVKLKAFFESRKTSIVDNVDRDLRTHSLVIKVNERLDKFYSYLKNNIWYNYISEIYRLKRIRGENWIDFESELSAVIQVIDWKHTSLTQTVSDLHKGLAEGADEELRDRIVAFTQSYGKVYGETVDSLGKVSDQRGRLYSDLEKLILALEIYLVDFVGPIRVDPLPVIQKIKPKPDYVISFNYTKTYERVYGIDPSNICHIHGVCRLSQELEQELADADNTSYGNGNGSNIVLGIDEYLSTPEEQKRHTDFSIFKKFVQRIRNHNDVSYVSWMEEIERFGSQPQPENVIEDDDPLLGNNKNTRKRDFNSDVFIFGHSLDVTDKDILQRFIASEFTRVHVYAHSKPAEGDLIAHLLRYVREETVIEKASMNPPMLEFVIPEKTQQETLCTSTLGNS